MRICTNTQHSFHLHSLLRSKDCRCRVVASLFSSSSFWHRKSQPARPELHYIRAHKRRSLRWHIGAPGTLNYMIIVSSVLALPTPVPQHRDNFEVYAKNYIAPGHAFVHAQFSSCALRMDGWMGRMGMRTNNHKSPSSLFSQLDSPPMRCGRSKALSAQQLRSARSFVSVCLFVCVRLLWCVTTFL